MTDHLLTAVRRLSDAFATRDLAAALDCFVPSDDISYVGSEQGERAHGRAAVAALFASLFTRSEAYSWQATELVSYRCVQGVFVMVEAEGLATGGDGEREAFAYRLCGLLEWCGDDWAWRACNASVPEPPG